MGDALDVLDALLHRLETRWRPPDPDQEVYWAIGALPLPVFWPGLQSVAKLTAGRRFWDLGCGIGRYLALAYYAGWGPTGVERHQPYVEAARALCPEDVEVIHAEITEVDRFDADVVYMYRPAVADELERTIIRHVADHAEPGCLLWLPEGDAGLGLPHRVNSVVWAL